MDTPQFAAALDIVVRNSARYYDETLFVLNTIISQLGIPQEIATSLHSHVKLMMDIGRQVKFCNIIIDITEMYAFSSQVALFAIHEENAGIYAESIRNFPYQLIDKNKMQICDLLPDRNYRIYLSAGCKLAMITVDRGCVVYSGYVY